MLRLLQIIFIGVIVYNDFLHDDKSLSLISLIPNNHQRKMLSEDDAIMAKLSKTPCFIILQVQGKSSKTTLRGTIQAMISKLKIHSKNRVYTDEFSTDVWFAVQKDHTDEWDLVCTTPFVNQSRLAVQDKGREDYVRFRYTRID